MLGQQPRAHLTHVDLGSLLEHGRAGHIETLLQPIEPQRLHLLIAALHLEWVVGQLGQLLHVLQGGRGPWHLSWGRLGGQAAPPRPTPCLGPQSPGPGASVSAWEGHLGGGVPTRASPGGPGAVRGSEGRKTVVQQLSLGKGFTSLLGPWVTLGKSRLLSEPVSSASKSRDVFFKISKVLSGSQIL